MASSIFSGIREPQKAYNWKVEFHGGEGTVAAFYAKSTMIPMKTVDVVKKYYAGSRYGYAGPDTTPSILSVTFWDEQGLPCYRFFQQWYSHVCGRNGTREAPDTYMRSAKIHLINQDGIQTNTAFEYKNLYPIELGEAPLVYADSAEFTFDVRFFFWEDKLIRGEQQTSVDYYQLPGA